MTSFHIQQLRLSFGSLIETIETHIETMATRIVENLQINAQPNEIKNWIKRLKAGIDMELFRVSGKLPEDTTLAAQMVETLKLNMLIANIGGPGLGELASLTAPDEPETNYSRNIWLQNLCYQ